MDGLVTVKVSEFRYGIVIVLASMIAALVQGLVLDWPEEIGEEDAAHGLSLSDLGELKEAQSSVGRILWIDGRKEAEFEAGTLSGAVLLNFDNWEEGLVELLMVWEGDQTIVVFCDGEECGASREIAARLRSELGQPVFWLMEGWDGLVEGGYVR